MRRYSRQLRRAPSVTVYPSRYGQRSRMRAMLRRSGGTCFYCGDPFSYDGGRNGPDAPSRDHKIPQCRGGTDSLDNIVTAHRRCNEDKGALDVEEYQAWREGRASRLDRGRKERRRDRDAPFMTCGPGTAAPAVSP